MNTEYKNNDVRKQESEINISDIFHLILANWYWFVLSVLVCGGGACFYLKSSSKISAVRHPFLSAMILRVVE